MTSKEVIMNDRSNFSPSTSAGLAPAPAPSRLALTVLLLGGFLTVFDLFVVNVAIPDMQADLRASFAEIGFVIAGYALSFGMFLIAGGRLGDAYGRRRLFGLGVLGFAGASLLCGVAPDAVSLILARLVQGAAGAILFPQIYALLRVLFDEAGRRRTFGLLGMTLGLAAIAGQVLGGLLVESDVFGLGWRVAFLINCAGRPSHDNVLPRDPGIARRGRKTGRLAGRWPSDAGASAAARSLT
jgi:MFS family permease